MCRFVLYAGAPTPVAPLVFGGSHPLVEQAWAPRELLSGHANADGWGVAWYDGPRPIRIGRPEPIWHAPDLEDLLSGTRSSLAVAAVRNATTGMPLGPEGVPPLRREGWTFVLNGFVTRFHERLMRRFHDVLSDEIYALHRTAVDAEALLLLVLDRIRRGEGPEDAVLGMLRAVKDAVDEEGARAQLNVALADGETAIVARTSSEEVTNSLYLARDWTAAPDGVVVASEKLDDTSGWEPVEPHSTLTLATDGSVRTRGLGG